MYAMAGTLVVGDGRGDERGEVEGGREISGRFLRKLLGLGSKAREGRGKMPRAWRGGEGTKTRRERQSGAAVIYAGGSRLADRGRV